MVIFGVLLVVAAGVGFYFMRRTRDQLHAMIGAETLPVDELERLRQISDELGARGGFRKQCEVVGAAYPRPEGLLVSEFSKTECVWHRHVVKRRFEERRYDSNGRPNRTRKTETVAEHTSWAGYALRDDRGVLIGVDPNGTAPDKPEQVVSRFEPYQRQQGPTVFGFQLPNIFDDSSTIGYEYEEWVIRPGQRLYVLGEVHDRIGPLVIGKPEQDGHFVISTRTEDQLRKSARTQHRLLAVGIPLAALAGIALIVLGAIG
ncbi:E3 ubiquitin ligase family protein [Saccharopolyspora sp. WRP15-2]|uniref:RING-type E3 ubiquitin transferase n=1 Tax=Saccharopolyspora oryzae TaxID=2997343 RepID=A0ABT4V847_9PSEU|nr:E3 ubiquitin ligase family protein [Saccharopolyspora oryzae]MDA3630141.1 E3 ubiquitin ligase family protein [Saccharopolyspora oryzae]